MTKTLLALALGGALIAAAPAVLAQTTTDTAPAAEPAPPAAADGAAPADLAMGQTAEAGMPTREQAQVGGTYLAAQFDAWEQRCVKTEAGKDPCQLYQLLRDAQGNSVAEISYFNLPEGNQAAAGATFMAPLETLLTANLRITVDTAETRIYPFAFCTRQGCVARLGFTAEEVEAYRKGARAVVTIVPAAAPDQTVDLELSLKGFTAGFKAVSDANAAQ